MKLQQFSEIAISFDNIPNAFLRTIFDIWDALCDLVPFLQFKKREEHQWRSVTFSKLGDFTEFCFVNTNGGVLPLVNLEALLNFIS